MYQTVSVTYTLLGLFTILSLHLKISLRGGLLLLRIWHNSYYIARSEPFLHVHQAYKFLENWDMSNFFYGLVSPLDSAVPCPINSISKSFGQNFPVTNNRSFFAS